MCKQHMEDTPPMPDDIKSLQKKAEMTENYQFRIFLWQLNTLIEVFSCVSLFSKLAFPV